jgi:hypothetical protein
MFGKKARSEKQDVIEPMSCAIAMAYEITANNLSALGLRLGDAAKQVDGLEGDHKYEISDWILSVCDGLDTLRAALEDKDAEKAKEANSALTLIVGEKVVDLAKRLNSAGDDDRSQLHEMFRIASAVQRDMVLHMVMPKRYIKALALFESSIGRQHLR